MIGDAFRSFSSWQPDDDAAPSALPVRWEPPDNEVPGVVGLGQVVTRTADVAVLLVAVKVHTTGVVLELALRRRVDPDPGTERFVSLDQGVLVGVETADGRVATSIGDGGSRLGDPDDDGPVLNHLGGGGGGRTYEMAFWLTPTPPPGDLTVVAAGEPGGLPEGSVVVPAALLAEARGRCQRLWAREPERHWAPQDVPKPSVPPGGWFERVLGGPRGEGELRA